ncbi:MAG: hypothetical protein RLZZ161_1645 [Bacteroidota bacterium]
MRDNSFTIGGNARLYAALALWVSGLLMLGFFTDRADFGTLALWCFVAFLGYFLLIDQFEYAPKTIDRLIWVGLLMRLVVVFAFPVLSDDLYRFYWDGRLMVSGISPFKDLPSAFMQSGLRVEAIDQELFLKMNSKDYYAVYPPVCQFVFAAASGIFPKNIYFFAVFLKLFLFCCEWGTLSYLKKMNVSPQNVLLYALNPLIIIELCGNAHFEAAMLFFFTATLYYLNIHKNTQGVQKVTAAAHMMALSVASKLLTLLFLPFILRHLGIKKGTKFLLLAVVFSLMLFTPFWDEHFVAHFMSSIALYFQNFEFNASVYYVLKALGNAVYGYTPVDLIAGINNVLLLGGLVLLFFSRKNFFSASFLMLTLYFILQRAIHPWYISSLVLFSVLVPWRYGLLWSGLVFLSYSHYNGHLYSENAYLLVIEYALLFGLMFREYFLIKKTDPMQSE